MIYREKLPRPLLSQHIECIWELDILPEEANRRYEVMAPDCTFDIIFSKYPLNLEFTNQKLSVKMNAGGAFVGQKTCSVKFSVKRPQTVVGIRFKPFAFANLVAFSPQINNKTLPLKQLFDLKKEEQILIQNILGSAPFDQKVQYCEKLVLQILGDNLDVDQMFRAQLNYILDRKGLIEVRELFSEFGISKVTLRKHFLEKMGLSPKIVSRIWRLNHFLELKRASDCDSLTYLALESGYYDQAHFIREFKSFFHDSPKRFFKQESKLLSISQDIIANRFSNHYDPVFLVT